MAFCSGGFSLAGTTILAAAGMLAAGAVFSAPAVSSAQWAQVASTAKSVIDVIADRSPGARPEGALAKSKKKMKPAALAVKRPSADDGVRRRLAPRGPLAPALTAGSLLSPTEAFPFVDYAQLELPEVLPPVSNGPRPPSLLVFGDAPGTSSGGGSSGGGSSGGGSSGGTGSSGGGSSGGVSSSGGGSSGSSGGSSSSSGGPPPVEPPTTVPAVPEPGIWLMMIFGFGAIGAMLRRAAGRALPCASA